MYLASNAALGKRQPRRGRQMTVKGLLAMAAALILGTAGSAAAQDAKLVAKGQQLYASQKCTMCHSVGDKGNKKGPLDGVGDKLSAEEIRQWLINPAEMTGKTKATRKPVMSSYAKLSKEDIEALVAYMQSLKKK
jgi:mono/diheme cytochrome c family protein